MLAFRDLRSTAQYFILKFDDNQAVAAMANPQSPGYYVLQYLAGDVALIAFQRSPELGLTSELKTPRRQASTFPCSN